MKSADVIDAADTSMTLHGGWPVKTPPSILTVLQSAALPFIMVVFRCSNDRFESLELFDK
jgi:hypothetical protein